MTVTEILTAARARVELNWGQGDEAVLFSPNALTVGPWCAATAITAGRTGGENYKEACETLKMAAQIDLKLGSLGRWNDAPERTKEEVLAAFDKAIEQSKVAS